MNIIHQIWVGAPLPERETAWVEGARAAAVAAGWEHRLWGWGELQAAFGSEPVARVLERAMQALPGGTVYAMVVDYYQYRVLAEFGGVYMDTDMEVTGDWPAFEPTPGVAVQGMPEFFNPRAMCCGLFHAVGEEGRRAMRMAAEMAQQNILCQLVSADVEDFEQRLVAMVRGEGNSKHGCGPAWLRREVLPAWAAAGLRWELLPRELAGHRQWTERDGGRSAITHIATAHWHKDRWEREGYWEQQAAEAARKTEERKVERARARLREMESRPPWLRPAARAQLPAVQPRKRTAAAAVEHAAAAARIPLPRGVRRIIVFANTTRQMDAARVGLRAGDLCIHVNRARHFEAARAVEGTVHFLIVRPRASVRTEWFTPPSTNGFERVYFARSVTELPGTSWWGAYRAAMPGKSPTTGFVAANMARELWPHVPLLLAGFDPAGEWGSYKWDGHDWEGEARWYAERGFRLLRPGEFGAAKKRLMVLITSCGANAAKRQACRDTWLRRLPEEADYRFVVGRGVRPDAPDVVQVDAPDGYEELPAKVTAALRGVQLADYEWIAKCDDDSYLYFPRLLPELTAGREALGYVASWRRGAYLYGGCYCLTRKAVQLLLRRKLPETGPEDAIITSSLGRAGVPITHLRLMSMRRAWGEPKPSNSVITCHELDPAAMREVHANFAPRILLLINSCWAPDGTRLARGKNERNAAPKAERRQACRDTWLAGLPERIRYRFVLGQAPAGVQPHEDELCTPHADALHTLGKRAAHALRWAVEQPDWDWLVRTDDDDYIDLAALDAYIERHGGESGISGMRCEGAGLGDLLAGCCQVMPRATAEAVARDTAYPAHAYGDDIDLTRAVLRAGGTVTMPPELQARPHPTALTDGRVSAYWLTPKQMHELHRTTREGWVAPIFTGGRLGNLLFELAAAYAHARRHGLHCLVPWGQYAAVDLLRQAVAEPLPGIEPGSYGLNFEYKWTLYRGIPAAVRGGVRGFFQSSRWFEDQRQAVRALYAPLMAQREPGTLGVHIRLGDYKASPGLYWLITADWLRRAIQLTDNKRIVLFFSDDDQEARDMLTAAIAGMDGYTVELQHEDPLADLRRLSAMEELIMSNSTFAWWAAWLGQPRRVIAPSTWYTDPRRNAQDLYLPTWTQL